MSFLVFFICYFFFDFGFFWSMVLAMVLNDSSSSEQKRRDKVKRKKRSKDKKNYQRWTCDECKSGNSGQCVRPEHCEAYQENLRVQADLLRDQEKEDGLS